MFKEALQTIVEKTTAARRPNMGGRCLSVEKFFTDGARQPTWMWQQPIYFAGSQRQPFRERFGTLAIAGAGSRFGSVTFFDAAL